MTTEFESTVTVEVATLDGELRLVDTIEGSIYEIPEDMIDRKKGSYTLKNIPIRDYPLVLMFGEFSLNK